MKSPEEPPVPWRRTHLGEATVWRIVADRCRDRAFDGEGARLYGGRWNPPGIPATYTSFHLSLAALELFVNLEPGHLPDDLVAVPAHLPAGLPADELPLSALPGDWRTYPAPEPIQELGAAWLRSRSAPVLVVPSAVLPRESNALLNPLHAEYPDVRPGSPEPFAFDPRMGR